MANRYGVGTLTFTNTGGVYISTALCPIGHVCRQMGGKVCPYFLGGGLNLDHVGVVCNCPKHHKLDPRLIFYEELTAPWEWPPKPLVNFGKDGLAQATTWAHATRGPFVLYVNHPAGTYVITTQDPDLVMYSILTEQDSITPIDPNMPM